jgi:hypothetical protein
MNSPPPLSPLPYHREVRDYLKNEEPELWNWFNSARAKENYAEELRLSLLKSTYRLTPEAHPALYASCAEAAKALGFDLPVTLYQAQSDASANAGIHVLPTEAHIIFFGSISTLLSPTEMSALLGHELAHHLFWQATNEDFLIADRLLHAVTRDPNAKPAHRETARRFRLHTEILADRGAALVAQNLATTVGFLVKITTGLSQVDGVSYLAQADEIFSKSKVKTEELSHPETYIRAHALSLWTKHGEKADSDIQALICGPSEIEQLDLISQQKLLQLTRRFLGQLLRPHWFQTDRTLAHAKLFFPEFRASTEDDAALIEDVSSSKLLLKDYFAYLLLDFAKLDPELEDVSLAQTLRWAEQLGITTHFEKLVSKELGVKAREIVQLKPRVADLLALADKGL